MTRLTRKHVVRHAAAAFGIGIDEMLSRSRAYALAHARFAAMLAIRELLPAATLAEIGRSVGDRDHTTVIGGLERGKDLLGSSKDFARRYADALSRARSDGLERQTEAEGGDTPYLSKSPRAGQYRASAARHREPDGENRAWWQINDKRFRAGYMAAHPQLAMGN